MKHTKIYDDEGNEVPERNQMCVCGHSAAKHVQTGLHYMNGYICLVRSCSCKSFKFDRIK